MVDTGNPADPEAASQPILSPGSIVSWGRACSEREGGREEPLDLTLCWSGYFLELEETLLCLSEGMWPLVEVKTAVEQTTFKGDS